MNGQPYDLLIDAGNTLVKWGRYQVLDDVHAPAVGDVERAAQSATSGKPTHSDRHCLQQARATHAEIPSLANVWHHLPVPRSILISSVAGEASRAALTSVLASWPGAPAPRWLVSQQEQCGVVNGYRDPGQLGVDRWLAMIGARSLCGGVPVLVVMCGTATTMDFVSADGGFEGGVIAPGFNLMLHSLNQGTAGLPLADGQFVDAPACTADAIVSGCVHAQVGVVERLYARRKADHATLVCMVSGGGAERLTPHLNIEVKTHRNLVMQGLFTVANAT